MKSFFSCIAVATELKNEEIRVRNVKIAGKRKSLNEFNVQQQKRYDYECKCSIGKNDIKYTFGLVPIVAGLDKSTNILTDWSQAELIIDRSILKVFIHSTYVFFLHQHGYQAQGNQKASYRQSFKISFENGKALPCRYSFIENQ